jgi:RNA-directed DNA polymerase
LADLAERLKTKRYKTKLIRRKYIPKENGKLRPLGIPALEDKITQRAVAMILENIYEHDFLECSYGYRPKRSARGAISDLNFQLQYGVTGYIVEAEIKGFFDNLDHDLLLEMLALRIDDKALLHLIRKWLKAGILEPDGMVIHPDTGTPQGGIVSPILANVYLHYVLDTWFHQAVKPRLRGRAFIYRYADDWVCGFQYRDDAERSTEPCRKDWQNSIWKWSRVKQRFYVLVGFTQVGRKIKSLPFWGLNFTGGMIKQVRRE